MGGRGRGRARGVNGCVAPRFFWSRRWAPPGIGCVRRPSSVRLCLRPPAVGLCPAVCVWPAGGGCAPPVTFKENGCVGEQMLLCESHVYNTHTRHPTAFLHPCIAGILSFADTCGRGSESKVYYVQLTTPAVPPPSSTAAYAATYIAQV